MKRVVFCSLLVVFCTLGAITATYAQHIISIQSAERRPFTIQVNGSKLNSSKTGGVRIGNLSAGNYSLVIKPAGTVPAQSYTCVVDNSDLSYTFINDAQKGWILKDTKSADELTATGAVLATPPPVSVPAVAGSNPVVKQPAAAPTTSTPLNSPFALMLAQVVHDPELLNSTPWILTTKVDGNEEATNTDGSNNAFAEQVANDTSTYEAATKGIIKAAQRYIKGGTEMTFVDFTATSGDTVHIMVPSTDTSAEGEDDEPAATTATTVPQGGNTAVVKNDTAPALPADTVKTNQPVAAKKEDAAPAFDTSANKQYTNPFFNKTTDTKETAKPAETPPVTGAPVTAPVADNNDSKKSKKADKKKEQEEVKSQPVAETQAPAPATTEPATVNAKVNNNCSKVMSDKDQEKLKHRIYLETDADKVIDLTKKAIAGKCITTAQVKDLATLFLTDDGRYHLFYTVYPNVNDLSNFSTLRTFMIDARYKAMFDALVK